MAFSSDRKESGIRPIYFGDVNEIIDESGSKYVRFTKTQWVKDGSSEDESKAKWELRQYTVDSDGKDIPLKGVRFLTDNGPGELAHALVKNGFGDTKELLNDLKAREDFKTSVEHMYDEVEDTEGEYFDIRNTLLAE